jgi:hypothetical protein
MMAARIEWEQDYLPKFKDKKEEVKKSLPKSNIKQPQLSTSNTPFKLS